ncbi:MAG TPA: hypothetical protein VJ951_09465 [Bacteroidales bacterium]|nr:hypothetical protein [Bacteroidales bacterium]
MIVLDVINRLKPFGIFSTSDLALMYPGIDKRRLFEWQAKGYIIKLRNGWYALPEFFSEDFSPWVIANLTHAPSYISLEAALSYYGIIPEGVFMTTSVTTNRPVRLEMASHTYSYSKIKPALFFGYGLLEAKKYKRKIKIADPEKSIVDFFYFRSEYNSPKAISELRFSNPFLNDSLNTERLFEYVERMKNKQLENRINILLTQAG